MSDWNAVGRRWTKAVAMRTPVPKCLERNRNRDGTGMLGKRRTTMGKEHAVYGQSCLRVAFSWYTPAVLKTRIKIRARICKDVL